MFILELDAHPKASQGQLNAWYKQYAKASSFNPLLVEAIMSDSIALQRNGSWLLKKHLEQKESLTPLQWQQICQALDKFESWELLLHLCQSFALNPTLNDESAPLASAFLKRCAAHKKPFVRAWAITGLHELAKQFPDLRDDAVKLVNTAVNDTAKSVQARIRNLK